MSTIKCSEIDDSGRGTWRVIYQSNGEDYCRENLSANYDSVDDAKARAERLFNTMGKAPIDSYKLERW